MLSLNVQLGYEVTRAEGNLSRVVYLPPPPPPRISDRMDNHHFLSYHLLQKYIVEIDINFISVHLRCSAGFLIGKGWGGGQAVKVKNLFSIDP